MNTHSTGLTRGALRHRRNSYLAAFAAILLGSTVLTSFAALFDIGLQPGVAATDRTTLIILSSVVGGWGAVIVGAAVAATLAVTTRQRAREIALLRSVGATPGQVVRMITCETGVVAGAAVLLAAPLGTAGGALLVHLLTATGQITHTITYRLGSLTYAIGAGAPLLAALLAAHLTARRAAARQVRDGLFEAAAAGRRGISQPRRVAGWVLLIAGFGNAVATLIVCRNADPASSQSIASTGAITAAIGFALLAPVLLERALPLTRRLVLANTGIPGRLALINLRGRTQQTATPIMPIVVLTGIATGTLSMQAVTDQASGAHLDRGTQLLNYVIVGIITALAAAMLINLLVITTAERRREFAQTRLAGATPDQLLQALRIETAVLTILGLIGGTIAAACTALPFSLAQGTGVIPLAGLEIHGAVVLGVTALTFATTMRTGRRAMAGAPIAGLTPTQ